MPAWRGCTGFWAGWRRFNRANVLVVVAGMEGALPSVVAGLVSRPVIAVPTSVGYGANFGGVAALLGMLNSCGSGVTVVNIDNGFGAGYAASQINAVGDRYMKTLYLDIFSGISGDMFLGALMDLGVDAARLERELAKLKLDGYHLHTGRQEKNGINGVKFDVHLEHDHEHGHDMTTNTGMGTSMIMTTDMGMSMEQEHTHGHEHGHSHVHTHEHHGAHEHHHEHEHEHEHEESRTFAQIKTLIAKSKLSPWVKTKATAVFQRLAEVEGKIHGHAAGRGRVFMRSARWIPLWISWARCIGLELLGKPRVLAAPVVEGTGWINCAHGRFPIPAPATLAVLGARGISLTQCAEPHELVTPTGAALLAEFAESFGPMDNLVAEQIGFGIGTRDHLTRPNVLRAMLGRAAAAAAHDWETDRVAVLETNCDDINAELLGQFVETALSAGALDVFYTPMQMKKNRPGVLLTVLCAEAEADKFAELILRETTAFGVRRTLAERRKLRREFAVVKTKFGDVTVKIGRLDGEIIQVAPEFESCKKLALAAKVPLARVYEAARREFKAPKE